MLWMTILASMPAAATCLFKETLIVMVDESAAQKSGWGEWLTRAGQADGEHRQGKRLADGDVLLRKSMHCALKQIAGLGGIAFQQVMCMILGWGSA